MFVRNMLEIDELQILHKLGQSELFWNAFDSFIIKDRLQSSQNDK